MRFLAIPERLNKLIFKECFKVKKYLLIIFLFHFTLSHGQNCDCQKELDFLINKIESDYAGFKDKVNKSNIKEYNEFTNKLKIKAKKTTTFLRCTMVMDEWLSFFKDKHLSLSFDRNIFFTYKRVDKDAILLRIPNFEWDYKDMIDSMVRKNIKEITSTPILIIDLRGNGGGTDYSFTELLPLIYTNPYISQGVEWWSSSGNIAYFEKAIKEGNIKKGKEKETQALVDSLKAHPNTFVNIYRSDSVTEDTIYAFPKLVGVIVDDFCASSCEQFVLSAKNSRKTIIFGTSTLGVLDYSNAVPSELLTKNLNVRYPMTRSARLPEAGIDNIGIKPDVEINLPVNLNIKSDIDEWVNFVNDYLKKKLMK